MQILLFNVFTQILLAVFLTVKQKPDGKGCQRKRYSTRRRHKTFRVSHQLPFHCGRHSVWSVVPGEPNIITENGKNIRFLTD